ncbi:hypothetical protein BVX98_07025 [bacterium F11]|nr:hypothetical protein BVX98_07025 [bacterium F11]
MSPSLSSYDGASLSVTSGFPESKYDNRHLEKALLQGFRAQKVFDRIRLERNTLDNPLPLRIQAHIVDWENVDHDRFFAGTFAGWNKMSVNFTLIDTKDDSVIGQFRIDGRSKGALSIGGRMKHVIIYITREAAEYLKKFRSP